MAVAAPPAGWPRIVVGALCGTDEAGAPLVDFAGNPAGSPVAALATAKVESVPAGRQVALSFVDGDAGRPIILGLLHQRIDEVIAATEVKGEAPPSGAAAGNGIYRIEGEDGLVLACGKASITLTSAGKIILRGTYVSSTSSGLNRIRGACVLLN